MEATIGGKRVTFRAKLPAKQNWDMLAKMQGLGSGVPDYDTVVDILRRAVESWELPGDPTQAESYAELDLFDEMMPMVKALGEWVQARAGAAKN